MESIANKFLDTWSNNTQYFDMLSLLASLSKLFSENSTPYLDYRLAENLFCKYFNAQNDARSCTAYDARIDKLGIGIKTFGIKSGNSTEKIAEFNKLKPQLDKLKGEDLARKISEFRNARIDFANNAYDVNCSIYHIVGRVEGLLQIFNTPYEKIELDKIREVNDTTASISFEVDGDFYSFNKSKSVLMKRFILPKEHAEIPVEILDDPLELLSSLLKKTSLKKTNIQKAPLTIQQGLIGYKPSVKGFDYVILPLFSLRTGAVPEKSGLNQWNAGGRARHCDEVYIPVPKRIHRDYPHFFPDRDTPFSLILPNGKCLSAKICQDGGKALMSNPNKDLGEWLLRSVLKKNEGELVTMNDLNRYGFDSICIENLHKRNEEGEQEYRISFVNVNESYSDFIGE